MPAGYHQPGWTQPPPPASAPAPASAPKAPPYRAPAPAPAAAPVTAAGPGPYAGWGNVPGGEQNVLSDLRNQFESLIGFTQDIPQSLLLQMANEHIVSLRDFGAFVGDHGINLANTPWAKYGLDKDQYSSVASIYGVEFKKVTGQDITQDALHEAFRNPRDQTGGLLTGSQYQQQLMQDANIQKTYGWVKYGMDYSAWQQQKLGMHQAMGRDVQDSEAASLLQYNSQARGGNQAAIARVPQQQPTVGAAGVGGSVVR